MLVIITLDDSTAELENRFMILVHTHGPIMGIPQPGTTTDQQVGIYQKSC